MRGMARFLAMAAAAAVGSACSEDATGPQADPCTDETSSVEATVATGTDVVFDWTPQCLVAGILVEGDDGDAWLITTTEEQDDFDSPAQANRIAPPVTYGQVPSGIPELSGPEPLIAGESYDLILVRVLPSGSSVLECVASFGDECVLTIQTFTRHLPTAQVEGHRSGRPATSDGRLVVELALVSRPGSSLRTENADAPAAQGAPTKD